MTQKQNVYKLEQPFFSELLQNNNQGMLLMHYLLAKYYDQEVFVPGDSNFTAYKAGQRSVIIDLIQKCSNQSQTVINNNKYNTTLN